MIKFYLHSSNNSMNYLRYKLDEFKFIKRNLFFNITVYFLIFIIEYILSNISKSEALKADAFNNLSGIMSTLLLFIGIHIASDRDETRLVGFPVSNQHQIDNFKRVRLSRFRFETVFTLITAVIIIEISIKVMITGIHNLIDLKKVIYPKYIGILGAIVSASLILIIYILNYFQGKKYKSDTLITAAKDSLGDTLTSIGTGLSIFIMRYFHVKWIGSCTTILISIFILLSGIDIFLKSTLNLVDYFDPKKEAKYAKLILNNKQIKTVESLNAHYSGNLIIIEAEVTVDKKMTIKESYLLADQIEQSLYQKYHVFDTKIIFYPNKL